MSAVLDEERTNQRASIDRPGWSHEGRTSSMGGRAAGAGAGAAASGAVAPVGASGASGLEAAGASDTTVASVPAHGFRAWRRQRPFVGGLLVVLAGIEMFFSGQLDLGNIQIQFGVEGLQATLIPVVLILVGVLGVFAPAQRLFYGIIALALAIYSLIGVNLGGFVVGMLLGAIGGVMMVAWMDPAARAEARAR
jgi:hypothetical protein